MKKKLKYFSVCLLALLCSFMLCGCSFRYDVTLSSSGAIESKITLDLSSVEKGRSAINMILNSYYLQLDKAYTENLVKLYSNVYDFKEIEKLVDDEVVEPDLNEKFQYIIKKNVNKFAISDIEYKHSADYKTIVISRTFISIYAYLMYFNPSIFEYNAKTNQISINNSKYKSMIDVPITSVGLETNEGLFVNVITQTCAPFYYNGEEPKFLYDADTPISVTAGTKLSEFLQIKTGISEEEVEMLFSFSTPYHRLHSDGSVEKTSKGYTHSWTLGSVNGVVTFFRNYSNNTSWYVIAGIVGFVILIFGLIIVSIVKIHKRKVGMAALKKINDLNLLSKGKNIQTKGKK